MNRRINLALVGWAVLSLVFLIAIEGLAALAGVPSISDRLAELNSHGGEVFVIWGSFTVGLLFGHWWAGVDQ